MQGIPLQKANEAADVSGVSRHRRRALSHIRAGGRGHRPLELGREKEVDTVAYNGPAERQAELRAVVGGLAEVGDIAREALVPEVGERRPVKVVRPTLCHGVDERAREVPVAHVVR
jgi:hypothetical protein